MSVIQYRTYPHLRELGLVGVEWYDHLVGHLVGQISPEHLIILRLKILKKIIGAPKILIFVRQNDKQEQEVPNNFAGTFSAPVCGSSIGSFGGKYSKKVFKRVNLKKILSNYLLTQKDYNPVKNLNSSLIKKR